MHSSSSWLCSPSGPPLSSPGTSLMSTELRGTWPRRWPPLPGCLPEVTFLAAPWAGTCGGLVTGARSAGTAGEQQQGLGQERAEDTPRYPSQPHYPPGPPGSSPPTSLLPQPRWAGCHGQGSPVCCSGEKRRPKAGRRRERTLPSHSERFILKLYSAVR